MSEDYFFNEVSTGSADDLNKATDIARAMVTQYSMSENVGLPTYELKKNHFLGESPSYMHQVSEKTSELIDQEVKGILISCKNEAESLIKKHGQFIKYCAKVLLDEETLEEQRLREIWNQHKTEV